MLDFIHWTVNGVWQLHLCQKWKLICVSVMTHSCFQIEIERTSDWPDHLTEKWCDIALLRDVIKRFLLKSHWHLPVIETREQLVVFSFIFKKMALLFCFVYWLPWRELGVIEKLFNWNPWLSNSTFSFYNWLQK